MGTSKDVLEDSADDLATLMETVLDVMKSLKPDGKGCIKLLKDASQHESVEEWYEATSPRKKELRACLLSMLDDIYEHRGGYLEEEED